MSKVLVLGGDGFCGWPTSLHLSARGHEVTIVDNLSRRSIDIELEVESLTPIQPMGTRLDAWEEVSGKVIDFHNITIGKEFEKLVARRDDVDLTIAALEIARDLQPDLDFAPTLEWIRERGRELIREVAPLTDTADVLDELVNRLSGHYELGGDADCYQRSESSCLNHVIDSKRGIPISLSLVYMAVAKEIGIELHGVSAPAHFLTRAETDAGPVFIVA